MDTTAKCEHLKQSIDEQSARFENVHSDSVRKLRTQIDETNQQYCVELVHSHVQMIKDKETEIGRINDEIN